jgi:hypothetical protein
MHRDTASGVLPFDAPLPQTRPFRAERRQVDTLSRKQPASTIGIRIKVRPEAPADAARSSPIRATPW